MSQVLHEQAVAGSGKTFRIKQKLQPHLEQGAKVTMVSFTKAIVADIEKDFRHPNLMLTNYHKLFFSELRKYSLALGFQADLQVLESIESLRDLKGKMEKKLKDVQKPLPERNRIGLDRLCNYFNDGDVEIKPCENQTVEAMSAWLDQQLKQSWTVKPDKGEPYEASFIRLHKIVPEWLNCLEANPALAPMLDVLAIDEVQDLDPATFRIFQKYVQRAKCVYLAGDAGQIIYGAMNGASPEHLKMFLKATNAEVTKSLTSRRCSQIVVEAANRVLSVMRDRMDLMSAMENAAVGSLLIKTDFNSAQDEALWIRETISSLGLIPSETAILTRFRVHKDVDFYAKYNSCHVDTIHSSKGREWKNVFIANYNDQIGDSEEEKRILYVAITRAKENLWITCPRVAAIKGQVKNVSYHKFINLLKPILN